MSRATSVRRDVPDLGGFDTRGFGEALLDWFAQARRDLPWRRGYDPYGVLVSEVMLQQTQMDRAVAFYERWMARFPDIASLAAADEDEVLRLWEGLGYYNRCRNLLAAARVLAGRGGGVPDDREALMALPGIGPYTAGAVLSVAFNHPEPAVDANVERVLARVSNLEIPVRLPEAKTFLRDTARRLIPRGRARDFNQALMELGALVCRARRPGCPGCPVASLCTARGLGLAEERPVSGPPREIVRLRMASGVLLRGGRVYIQKRRPGDVWPGLWEFPGGVLEPGETPEQALVREFGEETGLAVTALEPLAAFDYSYTRYRVTQQAFTCADVGSDPLPEPELREAVEGRFVFPAELADFAFPAPHRRIAEAVRADSALAARLRSR